MALGPFSSTAALSYMVAASSAVSNVPSQTRFLRLGSRISAAHRPHGRCRTPRNLLLWCTTALAMEDSDFLVLLNFLQPPCSDEEEKEEQEREEETEEGESEKGNEEMLLLGREEKVNPSGEVDPRGIKTFRVFVCGKKIELLLLM
ncbi:hypothetical protein Lal_00048474 [Lupinus albus]|nr:hypothetical protein Lal_00048474 [Lupinus albus]